MSNIKKNISNERGQVIIIVALLIVSLIGMTALVIDVGSLYQERRHLQTVADSAALAGAQELPESRDDAIEVAINYAASHGVDITSDDVNISQTHVPKDTITVIPSNPDTPVYFAKVFGINSVNVVTTATAMVGKPKILNDVVPWGVKLDPGEDWEDWLSEQTEKTLKYGPKSYEKNEGNFYALDIDPNEPHPSGGANEYYPRIVYGYKDGLVVGVTVWTEPGNMGKTQTKVYERLAERGDGTIHDFGELVVDGKLVIKNGQFVLVPVIHTLVNPAGAEQVQILAFAPFIITNVSSSGGNKGEVTGKFVSQALIVTVGSVDPVEDVGLRVIRLIK